MLWDLVVKAAVALQSNFTLSNSLVTRTCFVLKRNQKVSIYTCIASFLEDEEWRRWYENKHPYREWTRLAVWNRHSSAAYSIYLCFLLSTPPRRKGVKQTPAERYFPARVLIHFRSYGKRCGPDLLPLCSHCLSSCFNSISNKLRYGLNFPWADIQVLKFFFGICHSALEVTQTFYADC